MAKKTNGTCGCGWFLDDWLYALLTILLGLVFLGVNLGWLSADLIKYWPILLVIIGGKELIERN